MYEEIRSILLGQVYNETFQDVEMGGPDCAAISTLTFKLLSNLIFLPLHIFIIYWGIKSLKGKFVSKKVQEMSPTLTHKILGYMMLLVIVITGVYKYRSRQFIFMLNYCHIAGLMEAYILLTKFSLFNWAMFFAFMASFAGPFTAIVFPEMAGLDLFLEAEVFKLDHYLFVLIIPATILISYKYSTIDCIKLPYYLLGNSLFQAYGRWVLMFVSYFSWANMNHTLCSTASDAIDSFFQMGKYYYPLSELYVPFCNYFIIATYVGIIRLIFHRKFEERASEDKAEILALAHKDEKTKENQQ